MKRAIFLLLLVLVCGPAPASAENRDVTFASGANRLSGTLYMPGAQPAASTVILLPGGGNAVHGEGHQAIMIARFVALGMNVFAYDKPGVGKSQGVFNDNASIASMTDDAAMALAYIRTLPGFANSKIGAYGQSRSAWTAMELAARDTNLAFLIAISPAVMSTMEQEIYAKGNAAREQYALDDAQVAELDAMRSIVWPYLATGIGKEAAAQAWQAYRERTWFSKMGLSKTMPLSEEVAPDFRAYLQNNLYDVRPAAAKIRIPMLSVFGMNDGFVPAPESAGNLIAALSAAGNTRGTFVVIPQAGHVMEIVDGEHECTQCVLSGKAPLQPSPVFWETVSSWLKSTILTA